MLRWLVGLLRWLLGLLGRVLGWLDPYPACITGRRWDVLAWNRSAAIVFGDYAELPEDRRNALWLLFMDPLRRRLYLDWEEQAGTAVAGRTDIATDNEVATINIVKARMSPLA